MNLILVGVLGRPLECACLFEKMSTVRSRRLQRTCVKESLKK